MATLACVAITACALQSGDANAAVVQILSLNDGLAWFDYTVPTDGLTYKWTFQADSAHPDAIIAIDRPNDAFAFEAISRGGGIVDYVDEAAPYQWQVDTRPGLTTILVSSQGDNYWNCSATTPAGTVCGEGFNVWGDNARITLSENGQPVNGPDVVTFSAASAVPEPQIWMVLLLGLLGLGTALRFAKRPAPRGSELPSSQVRPRLLYTAKAGWGTRTRT